MGKYEGIITKVMQDMGIPAHLVNKIAIQRSETNE